MVFLLFTVDQDLDFEGPKNHDGGRVRKNILGVVCTPWYLVANQFLDETGMYNPPNEIQYCRRIWNIFVPNHVELCWGQSYLNLQNLLFITCFYS